MTNQTEQGAALAAAKDALELCVGFIDDAHILEAQWGWEPVQTAQAALAKIEALAASTPEGYTSDGWQPMDTAPKDGCDLLAMTMNIGKVVVYWDAYEDPPRWSNGFDDTPIYATHWMPLPLSPGAATPGDSHATP